MGNKNCFPAIYRVHIIHLLVGLGHLSRVLEAFAVAGLKPCWLWNSPVSGSISGTFDHVLHLLP